MRRDSIFLSILLFAVAAVLFLGCEKASPPKTTKSISTSPTASKPVEPAPPIASKKPSVDDIAGIPDITKRPRRTADQAVQKPVETPTESMPTASASSPVKEAEAVTQNVGKPVDASPAETSKPLVPAVEEPTGNPLRDGEVTTVPGSFGDGVPLVAQRQTVFVAAASGDATAPAITSAGTSKSVATKSGTAKADLKPLRKGKHSGVAFDPIKENGPIFENWKRPQLAIFITGMLEGYIEPCGCAGLDRMKGGMGRRYTLLESLRKQGWPVVAVDVGGVARGFGLQAEIKYHTLVDGMLKMNYDAIALGASDLRLPAGEVAAVAAAVEGQKNPFTSANVGLFGMDSDLTAPYKIIEAGGKKIGVVAVLGNSERKDLKNDEVSTVDPEEALKKILPKLKVKTDVLILLSHASIDETIALAKSHPEFKVVVTSGGPPEPPRAPKTIPGTRTPLIEVGHKGMNAIVLGFYDDEKEAENAIRYQRVPLDSRFASAPEMKALMASYQDQLKSLGLEKLGIRPVAQPQLDTNGKFVGTAKCQSCHDISDRIWKKTGHAAAYETLAKADPPRQFDPECVSCHVVGWNPTRFFPYENGFVSMEKTPHLIDVGCETCHGPGELHCKAELGSNEKLQERYRKAVRLTKEEAQKGFCINCHDLDNSPDFEFETYWPYVEHYEKDKDAE